MTPDFLSSASLPAALLAVLLLLLLFLLMPPDSLGSGLKGPPGPWRVPVLGNLLQLNLKNLHQSLWELSRKYGPVVRVWMGQREVVVLAGYRTVKEALVNNAEVFGERAPPPIVEEVLKGHGLVFSNGEIWKEMRRFALMNLKDFGMGKRVCEEKILEECEHLVDVFQEFKGEPYDSKQPLNYAVSNIIYSMLYGSRFEYHDVRFTKLVDSFNTRIQLGGHPKVQLCNMFPWLGRFISLKGEIKSLINFLRDENLDLIRGLKKTLNQDLSRCVVDSFLIKQISLKESGQSDGVYNEENLVASVMSLFGAGTETTSTTLRWSLLLMAKHQSIQDQVREEILRVIGTRRVQTEDRKDLPFTDAVIHEIQRLANIAPMSVPHRTSQDTTFQGHFIRKGTMIIPLLTSVLYDPSQWENPQSFYPGHFLKDGKFVKRDAFLPFSAGRRVCLGESLARMELFIFFTTLIQHFRFTPPPGVSEEDLDLSPITGQTLQPRPHRVCAVTLT